MLLAPPAAPSEAVVEASEASHVASPTGPSEEVAPTAVTSPRIRRSKVGKVVACVGDGPRQAGVVVGALAQPSPPATQEPVDVMGIVLGELAPAVMPATVSKRRRPKSRQESFTVPAGEFVLAELAAPAAIVSSSGRRKGKARRSPASVEDDALLEAAIQEARDTQLTLSQLFGMREGGCPWGHRVVAPSVRCPGLTGKCASPSCMRLPAPERQVAVATCVGFVCPFEVCLPCLEAEASQDSCARG